MPLLRVRGASDRHRTDDGASLLLPLGQKVVSFEDPAVCYYNVPLDSAMLPFYRISPRP
jgi:hypothetical protein